MELRREESDIYLTVLFFLPNTQNFLENIFFLLWLIKVKTYEGMLHTVFTGNREREICFYFMQYLPRCCYTLNFVAIFLTNLKKKRLNTYYTREMSPNCYVFFHFLKRVCTGQQVYIMACAIFRI